LAPEPEYDYVIVGSGAGGGTLAARLALAGMRVCLLEAGGDALAKGAGDRLPEDYEVPAFHPLASENPAMSWKFFVRHYEDDAKQKADPKWRPDPDTGEPSVFYPRAGTLGGCTAHNAMIFMAPNDSDWDHIAALTGDTSWQPRKMRRYFRRVEACRHRPFWRLLHKWFDPARHGWDGWLAAERALPRRIRDFQLCRMFLSTAWTVIFDGSGGASAIRRLLMREADPNDRRRLHQRAEGLCYTPLSTDQHRRAGTRERVLCVARSHPLHIEYDALATRVVFDDEKLMNGEYRATGVEYLKGKRLYGAHENASAEPGEHRKVWAAREVILAGGAFNTPQLLMLSGIGPREVLEKPGIDIPVRVELAGVGRNLQDRYEVAVVHRMRKPWNSLKDARFKRGDRLYKEWSEHRCDWHGFGGGMYISNGAAIAFSRRSASKPAEPDLFCMALLGKFTGYYPGYAREVCDPERHDYLTWALLKAYAGSRGSVTLRSRNPLDRPQINFNYFDETGGAAARSDVAAVVEGIKFVRKIAARLKWLGLITEEEEIPGPKLESDADLAQHVRDTAWGHHASCTCPIGLEAEGGVLSSDFKVHGTQGLRVVDASVFPRIPGFFIASAIYMIAEKAADVILKEANREGSGA
jgi:choline dehydrogenase